jgi:hypothetical protein
VFRGWHARRRKLVLISLALLLALLLPGALALATGLHDYADLKTIGLSGMHHLLAAEKVLTGQSQSAGSNTAAGAADACVAPSASSGTSSANGSQGSALFSGGLPDAAATEAAQSELRAAQGDFAQLQSRLSHPDWVLAMGGVLPVASGKLATARGLANAGYDVATLGLAFSSAALPLLTRMHTGAIGTDALLTSQDVTALQRAADASLPLLADMRTQLAQVSLDDLPLCAAQRATVAHLIGTLPRAQEALQQMDKLLPSLGWLLGLDHPRHFLVQELDRTELRATGGFSGQYGVLTVQSGRVLPFTLLGANDLDYGNLSNGWTYGRRPPDAYSWWPIERWGLRDANLNADFPTNAKMVMTVFKQEATDPFFKSMGGGSLDGVINFSPVAIAHFLQQTGPLYVPRYNETVTAANLEDRIHYYQLNPVGLAKSLALYPQDGDTFHARHRFAQVLASLLQNRLRHLPGKQLGAVARQALQDVGAHDIQIYVSNQKLEAFLLQQHLGGAIDTTPGLDSLFVVHTNWSAGKVNDHIKVAQQDSVTLDDKGGATHRLTVAVTNYSSAAIIPKDFVTYWDYVRIYAPPQAQLLSAGGFQSSDTVLCTSSTCTANPYPGTLVCPNGSFRPGPRTNTTAGSAIDADPPLMALGGPTATTSDVPGRAMWGGNIVVPLGCTMTFTASWYVPDVAAPAPQVPATAAPYSLLVQRQGGTFYSITVTILPAPHITAEGHSAAAYTTTLSTDLLFTLNRPPQPRAP